MSTAATTKEPYVSRKPDASGFITYTKAEHDIWATLYERQTKALPGRACPEYLEGLDALRLPHDRVPQLSEVSARLMAATGWQVAAVPALISFKKFFNLLANRQFPAATFIRRPEDLEYLQEPDIFHEVYGHCPLLTNPVYAEFMAIYGQIGTQANEKEQMLLARLYWFTVEFGLIQTAEGLRCYGAGLLSSLSETVYSLESSLPERRALDILNALRTPYRIDIFQTVYFVIQNFQELFDLAKHDLHSALTNAQVLGEFPPTYPPKEETNDNKAAQLYGR